ncbi:hypothetical protein BTO20_00400 [Mycobacterium dioxanotrophicus]|uniref:ABC-type quaternary amine transporter n=1 Tax=Mycobacterium dioxanotrophicus TaxID=482462 RepID=A0A1Y0CDF8_9MYCO|nr:hypothetical protein BTO20_00400 [Mycobacterium dioxanotrophicus]
MANHTAVQQQSHVKNLGSSQEPGAELTLRDLRKAYGNGGPDVVGSLSLTVPRGKLVALLGPSGCGKTTTLRMVAGLLAPTSGRIILDGQDISRTPIHKRNMGMVFQSYALFPHMTVDENVAFGLQVRKMSKTKRAELVDTALAMVHMKDLGKRSPRELSGGQQQRVSLARALVVEPKVLLLDEPLSNLDAKLRESMRTEISQIQQRLHTTTLFVTHDQDEALDMSDLVAIMNNGIIEQIGTPAEVYEQPRTEFVARFIGNANLIPVTAIGSAGPAGNYEVSLEGRRFAASGPDVLDVKRCNLLIRPHHLIIDHPRDQSVRTPLKPGLGGVVQTSGYTGDRVSLTIEVGDRSLRASYPARGGHRPQPGDRVTVSWEPSSGYLVPETSASETPCPHTI